MCVLCYTSVRAWTVRRKTTGGRCGLRLISNSWSFSFSPSLARKTFPLVLEEVGLPSTGSLLHQQFLIGDGAVGWACECLIRQRAAQNRERENNGSRATGARVPNRHGWLIRTRAIRHLSPPPFHHVIESCFFFDYKAPESLRARQEYRSRGCWSSFLPSRPRRLFSREFSWFLRLELGKKKRVQRRFRPAQGKWDALT